jgi:hypothetical protein
MSFGSRTRSGEDAVRHVLKRRLPRLDPADHTRYVELECTRTVELLRAVRDEYRRYLEDRGAKPLAEMYWVVFRFGVIDWAVMILRAAALEYIDNSRINTEHWEALFEFSAPLGFFGRERQGKKKASPTVQADEALSKTVNGLLGKDVFDEVRTGGPFGRDGQLRLGRSMPGMAFLMGRETILDAIKKRQELWDKCWPWTEGLARLFDAAQEELFFQSEELGEDGRRAELGILQLSSFQRIAYKHLHVLKSGELSSRNLGEARWLALLGALDEAKLDPDRELRGNARSVLRAVRQKGQPIERWEQCYHSKTRVTLEDGKVYTLKREVMHAIHNAAKAAEYQLRKVWSQKPAK